jgi:Mrp family chromosome partitioning ATPase
MDGDLRKGRIHDMLKLQSKPGLSDLLRQPDDPQKYLQTTDLPNFSFLSSGQHHPQSRRSVFEPGI